MKVYKGTDKDMKCRGMQYELGKTYKADGAVRCGDKGFHSCEAPLDVFRYYAPATSRYFEAEADGKIDRDDSDSKVASSELTLKAEIGIPQLIKAQFEYVRSRCTTEHRDPERATAGSYGAATAGDSGAATAGYRGAATAGSYGAATAGSYGAATAGDSGAATSRGNSAVGENGLAVARGNDVKVKGGLGAVLVIAVENDDDFGIEDWKAVLVDGQAVKADVWYTLKDGELLEVE